MKLVSRIVCSPLSRLSARRLLATAKVGDPVPINYSKDGKNPVIKKDEEYPAWVFDLTKKLPTRRQLVEKIEAEGVDSLTYKEMKRVKRSLTTDLIKKNNADALAK